MNKEELLKLAKENKEVAEAIVFLTKSADDATQFNESIPAVGGAAPQQGAAAQPQQAVPIQAPQGAAAVPADQQALQMAGQGAPAPIDPVSEGAKAAQAFLAPAFQAAAQGDVNAQRTVALAAGEVARGVAQAANEAGAGGAPAPVPATPEEQTADKVVAAPVQAKAEAKPEGEKEEGTDEGEDKDEKGKKKNPFEKKSELMFSADTVHGLIQLAKAGII
jgi:hypothetical protein